MLELKDLNTFLFDLDGTIYAGESLISGSKELVEFLVDKGKNIFFITNNSLKRVDKIAEKLKKLGIDCEAEQIISPLELAGKYIKNNFGISRVYVIGSDELKDNVLKSGHQIIKNSEEKCDVVLVGRDISYNYQKLEDAVILLQKGAQLVATNLDDASPVEDGILVPETGSLVAGIRSIIDVNVEVIGKPSIFIFQEIVNQKNIDIKSTVLIGDDLETDIYGAKKLGVYTIWLAKKAESEDLKIEPNLICSKLDEVLIKLHAFDIIENSPLRKSYLDIRNN